jgi:hypothetical protein
VAVEDIGGLWTTKQPGYDDTADIQAALKAFLYGSYTYDTTATDPTQIPPNSLASYLQDFDDRLIDQEELGAGSDYLTLAEISALSSPADGYIAMASDSTGAAVQSTYGVAFYQDEAPSTNLTDGILWIDKDSENKDLYVYKDSSFVKIATYSVDKYINAKGDLVVGSAEGATQILSIGDNGKILTADSTAPLGMSWTSIDYENNKNIDAIYFGDYAETSTTGIHLNGVLENEFLKSIDTSDLEVSITKSPSSTKTRIMFNGICRPTTDTNVEAFVGLQRKINAGTYETIATGLVSKELTSSNFTWIDSHGATTGDTVSYKLINITPNGYLANVITQRFGETSDTFMVEEI